MLSRMRVKGLITGIIVGIYKWAIENLLSFICYIEGLIWYSMELLITISEDCFKKAP